MKRLFPILFACFLLAGCGPASLAPPKDVPTTDEVAERYTDAAALYNWFDAVSPPCTGDAVELDGNYYRKVDVDGPETYAQLEEAVHTFFAPALADSILSGSQNFRDIDGQLYCAEGGRGSNIDLYDKTVEVRQADDDHFTVELTFWTNSLALPGGYQDDQVLFGYSRETLNYERVDEGFRFTNFCSSDALDIEADTVCTFHPAEITAAEAWKDFDDWKLLCWISTANPADTSLPQHELLLRFLDRPQDILRLLGLLYASPFMGNPDLLAMEDAAISPAYTAAERLYPDEYPDFLAALDACHPENNSQKEVLDLLRQEFNASIADAAPWDSSREFAILLPDASLTLTLGEQMGTFPWGFSLKGAPVKSDADDTFGTVYTADCGEVQLSYCMQDDVETLLSIDTTVPPEQSRGYYCTPRGLSCGSTEDDLRRTYLHAVKLENFDSPDADSCWVYEEGTCHIAAYCRNSVVVRLHMENLLDRQLLEH